MIFRSTRGLAPEADIRAIAMTGLAPDGGLYLPKEWPCFSPQDIAAFSQMPYEDIACFVLRPFLEGAVSDGELREIVRKSYAPFVSPDVAPLRDLGPHKVLELFHGPTLAFKDVALQFVGHMFEKFLQGASSRITVIGATSGDTGSAAIDALANRENVDVFILYPDKGPSAVQRRQMTCVDAPNVHAIAVKGSFDDCQSMVKAMFADERLRERWGLTTVNSINFLRILAQTVYYFAAAAKAGGRPSFVVPTGNFGNIFAGYAAKKCGAPIEKLVIASNRNNILTRFFGSGEMKPEKPQITLSPSMDIQISSNFERLLFDLCHEDAAQVRGLMADLKERGSFCVSGDQLALARQVFDAGCANDEETLAAMATVYKQYGIILDPHTAVGVHVGLPKAVSLPGPLIFLATADPAKFPETVEKALGVKPPVPDRIKALMGKPERIATIPADIGQFISFIEERKKNDDSNNGTR